MKTLNKLCFLLLAILFLIVSFGIVWKEALVFLIFPAWILLIKRNNRDPLLPCFLAIVLLLFKLAFELFNSNISYPLIILFPCRLLFYLVLGIIILKGTFRLLIKRLNVSSGVDLTQLIIAYALFVFVYLAISIGFSALAGKFAFAVVLLFLSLFIILQDLQRNEFKFFCLRIILVLFAIVPLFVFARLYMSRKAYSAGIEYIKGGDLYNAEREFKKAIFLDTINKPAYVKLIEIYKDKGRINDETAVYDSLFKAAGRDQVNYSRMGDLYLRAGDWKKAARVYEYCKKSGYVSFEIEFNLASAYEKMGLFDKAAVEYARAFKDSKGSLLPLQRLKEIYLYRNLIINGEFAESGKDGVPSGWQADQCIISEIVNNSGKKSYIEQLSKVRYSSLITETAVIPGIKYMFSINSFVPKGSTGRIDIFGDKHGRLLSKEELITGNGQWQEKKVIVEPREGDTKIIIFLQCLEPEDKVSWVNAKVKAMNVTDQVLLNSILK